MKNIDPEGDIQSDKGQYLAYLYNIGAGGFYTNGSKEEINEAEFDNLIQCYMIATKKLFNEAKSSCYKIH